MSNASVPRPPVAASGQVTNVQAGQGQNDQGQWVKGKNVTYQLSGGQTGTVFIPDSMFNPDMVKAAVRADAQKLADVHNLTF
jgi:hypothetical protein